MPVRLKKNGEHYEMDFAQMESMVDEHTKMMILCNPHNPTGRAWTKEELVQVADFCREHDLILFTDEIHGASDESGSETSDSVGCYRRDE